MCFSGYISCCSAWCPAYLSTCWELFEERSVKTSFRITCGTTWKHTGEKCSKTVKTYAVAHGRAYKVFLHHQKPLSVARCRLMSMSLAVGVSHINAFIKCMADIFKLIWWFVSSDYSNWLGRKQGLVPEFCLDISSVFDFMMSSFPIGFWALPRVVWQKAVGTCSNK